MSSGFLHIFPTRVPQFFLPLENPNIPNYSERLAETSTRVMKAALERLALSCESGDVQGALDDVLAVPVESIRLEGLRQITKIESTHKTIYEEACSILIRRQREKERIECYQPRWKGYAFLNALGTSDEDFTMVYEIASQMPSSEIRDDIWGELGQAFARAGKLGSAALAFQRIDDNRTRVRFTKTTLVFRPRQEPVLSDAAVESILSAGKDAVQKAREIAPD